MTRRAFLLAPLLAACGDEVLFTFTGPPDTRLSSLQVTFSQNAQELFSGGVPLDGGSQTLPASLRVLVHDDAPIDVSVTAIDWNDTTRSTQLTAPRGATKAVVDLSEVSVCPAPPPRPDEVVLFDERSHDRDEFTWDPLVLPTRAPQACSGTVSLQVATTTTTNGGIGLNGGRMNPQGLRYRRLSLRLWASREHEVMIGLVNPQPLPSFWLPTNGSRHPIGPTWKSFTFDIPDSVSSTFTIEVGWGEPAPPITVRLDDVRVVPR